MKPVTLYGTGVCPYCDMAERLLARKGVTPIKSVWTLSQNSAST